MPLVLGACDDPESERQLLNEAATEVDLFDGTANTGKLVVRVFGGAVVDFETPSGELPRVRVRAQSLDVRVEVLDRGCEPQGVRLEVSHLPADFTATYRTLLGAESAIADDANFQGDPHDATRTPLEAELPFTTTETTDGAVAWTVLTARSRRLAIVPRADLQEEGATEIEPSDGACAALDTDASGDLGNAALVVRHRLRTELAPPFHFAVWGNNAGHVSARATLIESVRADADGMAFAIVTGDLTSEGTTSQLRLAAEMYDGTEGPGLGVPWFATLGDRDVVDTAAASFIRIIGRSTFAFDAGPVRLMVLDSADFTLTPETLDALDDWLPVDAPLWWTGEPPSTARLVFTHVPPFEPFGGRGAGFKHRREAARVTAALRRHDVAGLFSSHLGLFDERDIAGVPTIYSGGAGAELETTKGTSRHWMKVSVAADGSVTWTKVTF